MTRKQSAALIRLYEALADLRDGIVESRQVAAEVRGDRRQENRDERR